MGFGADGPEIPMLLQPGVLSLRPGDRGPTPAAGLAFHLTGSVGVREPAEAFTLHHLRQRRRPALEVLGLVDGVPVVLEHVTRLRADLVPRRMPSRAVVPHEISGELLLRHGHSPEQPPGPQPRRTGRHRDAHRQRDPAGRRNWVSDNPRPTLITGAREVRCFA